MSDRIQYVDVNGVCSGKLPVAVGVPQGSILGPLLFLVYINDMQRSTSLSVIHYADDTTAFVKGENLEDLYEFVNLELDKINLWLKAIKLSLNVDKNEYIIFSNRSKHTTKGVSINGTEIFPTEVSKFLGVLIDANLKFNAHFSTVCQKVAQIK